MTRTEAVPYAVARLELELAWERFEQAFKLHDPGALSDACSAWWDAYLILEQAA